MVEFLSFISVALNLLGGLLLFVIGIALMAVIAMFILDKRQHKDTIRHNYPVIGRFRSLFITLGEFFRQYFFAMDREEMPFNRAEREWVKKSAEGLDNTAAFGSTRNLSPPGTVIFANAPFPAVDDHIDHTPAIVIGANSRQPYHAKSLINVSAMSYGALSKVAIEALSKGAAKAGCWLNTGEGGLSSYHLAGGCDLVMQLGTAKYGARDADGNLSDTKLRELAAHDQVKMFELKMAQGAKPGKGGILPASKVTEEIAKIRGITVGKASISPNRHPEASNNEELLELVTHIREVTGKPCGIKIVMGDAHWLAEFCHAIHDMGQAFAPDYIQIDSGDGGTGAAPMPLMDNVGMTIREALPRADNVLRELGLRERIKLVASGKLVTPAEVAWAYCAGADFVVTARGFMFALGCIQALKCNKNTCPTGITTHDPYLQGGLDPLDKAEKVANFVNKMHDDLGILAHSCGVAHPRALKRCHARLVQPDGSTKSLSDIYPPVA